MLLLLCGILLLASFIYIPGTLLARAFGTPWLHAIALAPILATFEYVVLGVALYRCGVFATWTGMVVPVFALSLLAYCASIPIRRKVGGPSGASCEIDVRLLAVGLAFSFFVAAVVFLGSLDGAESFNQGFDNGHHLSQVAATVQFGNWSTLNVSMDGARPGVFYPSVFHIYAALVVSCLGLATSCAMNATIFLLIAVIYPFGVYMLASAIFPQNRLAPICCTILALAFPGFPWISLRFCPLLANVAGFALVPLALWAFIRCFEDSISKRVRLGRCAFCMIAFTVVAVAHPSAFFSLAVFLFPFCVWKLIAVFDETALEGRRRTLAKVLTVMVFGLLSALAWKAVQNLEAFRAIVEYEYDPLLSMKDAIIGILIMRFQWFDPILPLAFLVLVGFFAACRSKDHRWLVFTYLMAAVQLVFSLSCESGPLKFFLCGFWYNHHMRLAASFAICALPLAGLGLSTICDFASSRWVKKAHDKGELRGARELLGMPVSSVLTMALALFLVCFPVSYAPGKGVSSRSIGRALILLKTANDWDGEETAYSVEEREFVKQAVALLPEGAVVMNFPYDGTCYSYGLDGLNTFYRSNATGHDGGSAEDIVITRLCDVAYDPEVQAAAKELGIEYVIQLDHGLGEGATTLKREYNAEDWIGILSIDDDTEGFEAVLASGDMRLDRIVYPE